jgi:hypothetical protein
MDGYIVAGQPSTFPFQPNDSRIVQFPATFALRVDFVRSVRALIRKIRSFDVLTKAH